MHRLFHSLVVCSAGLTIVQCGGKSKSDDDQPDPARGGMAPSSGGSATAGSGDRAGSAGGGGVSGLAGNSRSGGGMDNGAAGETSYSLHPDGPSEQWLCNATVWCGEGGQIPLDGIFCALEAQRPVAAADCQPDELFTCMSGLIDGESVRYSCECAAAPEINDPCPCPQIMVGECSGASPPVQCSTESICFCALTCILR
jgi:hypothetical protein